MTNRLWNYLKEELDTPHSYVEFKTVMGTFEVEPNFNWDDSELLGFIVYHKGYMTSSMKEPNIWFWGAIDEYLFE